MHYNIVNTLYSKEALPNQADSAVSVEGRGNVDWTVASASMGLEFVGPAWTDS